MKFTEKLYDGFTYFDGGCGSILQAQGLQPGELPETWNVNHARIIQQMHFDYLLSGVNVLTTNTFGANPYKFGDEGEYSLKAVISAAINNARIAIEAVEKGVDLDGNPLSEEDLKLVAKDHFIAFDISSLGKLLKPIGNLDFEDAVTAFKAVVRAGVDSKPDLVLVETMTDGYEAKACILAAKEESDLPIVLTCAFDESAKLLTGTPPKAVVAMAEGLGVVAVGINCSLGPEQMILAVEEIAEYASVPVVCNPNAGLPRSENGKTVYDVGPDDFAESMSKIIDAGAVVLGGCCGTTPAHIRALNIMSRSKTPSKITKKNHSIITSYTHAVEFDKKPILIGERINPTGKSKFKQALRDHNIDYIIQEGLTQQDNHADVLDVNVGLPEIDEVAMMVEVVTELQSVTDLPLQIDTTDPIAMEKALRIYNGKAMVNSVNGKEEVMEAVFPLVQKYGGFVVALTIDEDGIPDTAQGRIEIAKKIYKKAAEYGIDKKDIIVDPLCMSISAQPDSALVTLEAVRLIRDELGGKSSLGVSNISFGLPQRIIVNSNFFTMAMQCGLNAAIMNPNSVEMMKAYYSFNALSNIDNNCGEYIEFATSIPETAVVSPSGAAAGSADQVKSAGAGGANKDPLIEAINRGLKDRAASITKEYLESKESIEIIDGYLIPALDIVGKGFEAKTVFLPQLLMAAEAASAAFDVIKAKMNEAGGDSEKKGKVVMATVKGDIHDIGKNIVVTLLENYGYEVFDLGKDVPPELIVETAKANDCKMVGLSALMTTTVPSMEETIKLLHEEGVDTKVVVGGAVLTQEYADMIGADKYAKDAMETVRYAEELFAK